MLWLYRFAAAALMFVSGWYFGRVIPHWGMDQINEDPRDGTHYPGGSTGHRSCWQVAHFLFFDGAFLSFATFAGAWILAEYGWPELRPDESFSKAEGGMFLSGIFWMLLPFGIAGYVVSRLTDKGPVGPLE